MCCLQEVLWRGQGVGYERRKYKLSFSENGVGDVGVILKEGLCEKVVEVKKVSDGICGGF